MAIDNDLYIEEVENEIEKFVEIFKIFEKDIIKMIIESNKIVTEKKFEYINFLNERI
jgi:hypothetical protein